MRCWSSSSRSGPALVAALLLAAWPAYLAPSTGGGSGIVRSDLRTSVEARDTLSAAVDDLFASWHRPDSPGAAVLVLRNGDVVHAKGYGMASLEQGVPIRPHTIFDIASISKQFGAFAVALLEADGLLSVDDPVHRYLPELPDFGHPITLRHLVHHTSGMRDWPGTLSAGGWDYQDVLSFEQILRMAFQQQELNFVPGSEYSYSNTGYNLLAEVVARVSGSSFREFTQERIFGPLGMTRTHFHDDHGKVVPGRADSYRRDPGGEWRTVVNSLTALGSSSLFTTVEDLARWVGNFETGAVGGARVLARVHERGVLNGGDTIPYAWGQSLGDHRGAERWSHTGSWAGFRTVLHRFPEHRFAVIVLANAADMNPSALADRVVDLYLGDLLDPPVVAAGGTSGGGPARSSADPEAPWSPDAAALSEYAGEYASDELSTGYRIEVREGRLVARHFRTGGRVLTPRRPDRFEAPTLGEIAFLRDSAGAVTGFTVNQARVRGLLFRRLAGAGVP
jgi:CubicO group peptidase (beta-lactamase class C family)